MWSVGVVLTWLFSHGPTAFAEDENFVARNVEFFQCLADNFFRDAIAVHVGGIPGIEAAIVCRFEQLQCLVTRR